jgi:opacity protein-like surface antigen
MPSAAMEVRMMKPALLLLVSIPWIALSAPSAARAEGFFELRLGGAFTEDNDVEINPPGNAPSFSFPTEYDDSVAVGARGGYWFLPWLGVAGDVSYFAPEDDTGGPEYDVFTLSPLLMARVPIATSHEFPDGRVQPYLGVGPGIFVSSADFGPDDDDTVDVGADVHAGLNVQVTPLVSVFAEYRFTWVEPEFDLGNADVEPELATHHFGVGVGFHF